MTNWRLVELKNPSTENVCVVRVRADGKLGKADQKRFGIARVPEWVLIRAESRAEASEIFQQGGGEKVSADGVVAPIPAPTTGEEASSPAPPKKKAFTPRYPASTTSRACAVCWKEDRHSSRMRGHVRHLHELTEGEFFRFEGRGDVFKLDKVSRASARISLLNRSSVDPCAPGAEVIPLQRAEGE